jgi:hypothetical protein
MSEKKTYTKFKLGTLQQSKFNFPDGSPKFGVHLGGQKDKEGNTVGENIFPITLANGLVITEGQYLEAASCKALYSYLVRTGKMTQEKMDQLSFNKFDLYVSVEDKPGTKKPTKRPPSTSDDSGDDIAF